MYRARVARGTLITIEGLDGAGKSTLAAALHGELAARGAPVELLREPGGVEVSERIRALVQDPALDVLPRTEALLYAAARAQLVDERLEPLLRDGAIVLLDRFVDSSLAYQGAGRGLGVEEVRAVNLFATAGLRPDRTLLLASPPPPDARASASARSNPIASSAKANGSSRPSPPPTSSSRARSRSGSASSTPPARPSRC